MSGATALSEMGTALHSKCVLGSSALCTWHDGDEVAGISLINGSRPRSCSSSHCGIVKLDIAAVEKVVDRVRRSAGGVST